MLRPREFLPDAIIRHLEEMWMKKRVISQLEVRDACEISRLLRIIEHPFPPEKQRRSGFGLNQDLCDAFVVLARLARCTSVKCQSDDFFVTLPVKHDEWIYWMKGRGIL